ncbi:hypothetical protein M0638_28125 [Roseomonas sp. NAR14]|uniref:Uncharacterized protein n=1 Tax=Roseomonas acroporae TaxID=2937791 RepID=A0A9X1YGE8_9PROT|nr:hypothetical protein [Roseomonas acroporae]MCK8788222.1 hypothetical protein [Roseomonas acroporae]
MSAILPRRGALRGAAMALAAARAVAAPSADAELLRLGAEFERLAAAERRAWDLADAAAGTAGEAACDAAAEEAQARTSMVVRAIEGRAATTAAGILVKARALAWCGSFEVPPVTPDMATNERLTIGIIGDALRLRPPVTP